MEHRLLTVREVAAYLGVTTQSVHNWLKAGRLQALRPTKGTLRIPEGELIRFIEGEE